ncbi:unnamed protein product [Meganyctiphanes norvegica]|uniref:Uncharacterized protein n=1 Tax=Meganyctiphanes norvegica TaxID=48144 RepID=A0AAV2RJL7_MEGNR
MSVEVGLGHGPGTGAAIARIMSATADYQVLPVVPGLYTIPRSSSYCRRTLNRAGHNCLVKAIIDVIVQIKSFIQIYRVGLGIIAIVSCVCLLSMPTVPERFLGIRSPQRVLMEYRLTPHPGNDSVLHPVEVNQSHPHSVHKRHAVRVPHKFWAKARPHNKFKKKKHAIPQVAAPVPNPYIIKRH